MQGATRTNYFKVKDAGVFKEFMHHIITDDEDVDIWSETGEDGQARYAFGCYGSIIGYRESINEFVDEADDGEEADFNAFIAGLQKHVAEDDAIILMESGNLYKRSVYGYVNIITSSQHFEESLVNIGVSTARQFLNNPKWETQHNY